jgi:hypothetical protein
MRSINDVKNEFKTHGNTNGVYGQMQKEVGIRSRKSVEARARFDRKPWHIVAAENLKKMREIKEKSDGKEID